MKQIAVVLLLAVTGYVAAYDWSYEYQAQWPGVCRTGREQTPINIMTRSAIQDRTGIHLRGPLVFNGYDSIIATAENDGHTLKWAIVDGAPQPTVSGGPLRGNYSFLQFHIHWLSEHAIDGMKYPMEIHLVHVKTGLTVEEALQRPDGLAVIGIMVQLSGGEDSDYALAELAPVIPQLMDRGVGFAEAAEISLSRLFSPAPQSYFNYHGSLTTPTCQEVVTWIVNDKPIVMTDEQFNLFRSVDVGGVDNYRSLQSQGSRVVYRSTPSSSNVVNTDSLDSNNNLFSIKSFYSSTSDKKLCIFANMRRMLLGEELLECTSA